jgi:hypothetical protein
MGRVLQEAILDYSPAHYHAAMFVNVRLTLPQLFFGNQISPAKITVVMETRIPNVGTPARLYITSICTRNQVNLGQDAVRQKTCI